MGLAADQPTVVFDLGSSCIRVGLATKAAGPKLSIPAVVGRPRRRAHVGMKDAGGEKEDVAQYVGLDVARHRAVCEVSSPLCDGRLERVDDLRALIQQGFELLSIDPETASVIATVPPDATRAHRNEIGALFLRDLRVPGVALVEQGATAVFGCGLTSGLVVDVGEHSARCFAVLDGIGLPGSFVKSPIAGHSVTQHLHADLVDNHDSQALSHVAQVKEALCYVRDVESASRGAGTVEYALPDGNVIRLGDARHLAPEVLFEHTAHRGSVVGAKAPRIPDIVRESLRSVEGYARDAVAPAIVVCGGTAMTRGFGPRLDAALKRSYELPPGTRASLHVLDHPTAPCDRSWVGAAVLGALSSFENLLVTQSTVSAEGFDAMSGHKLMDLG